MIDPADPRARDFVEKVYNLGAPALLHLLAEVDRGASVTLSLQRYARLPAAVIREFGGDRFAPRFHVIDGGRSTHSHLHVVKGDRR